MKKGNNKDYIRRGLKRIGLYEYEKLFIYKIELTKALPDVPADSKIRVQRADMNDIKRLTGSRDDKYIRIVKKRFSQGDSCYYVEIEKLIVSFVWAAFNSVYHSEVRYNFSFENDEVALIDALTMDEYRGKGIYKHLYWTALHDLKRSGYTNAYGFVLVRNKTSKNVHDKLGGKNVVKTIEYKKVFWKSNQIIKDRSSKGV